MKEIIFASGNKGKIKEVQELFTDTGIIVKSLYELGDVPEIIEDGLTFEANARIKAQTIYKLYSLPVIADDSGLEVEQLDNKPGVYSARYAGENCTYDDNNRKLLNELIGFPEPHKAKFVCCAVFYSDKNYIVSTGELSGEIVNKLRGNKGFGYDPVFRPLNSEKTLAEYDLSEKNEISHRGIAFRELKQKMKIGGVI